jgi:hypothetical protein
MEESRLMAKQSFLLPKLMPRDKAICRIVDALEDLPISEGFRVEIHEHAATRTEAQNNTLWWIYGNILKLGGETMGGWEKDDLHDFFLGEHFGTAITTIFGKKRRKPVRRSSRLSKTEFSGLVDFIYRFMAQQGVALPEPDPAYAFHEKPRARKAA